MFGKNIFMVVAIVTLCIGIGLIISNTNSSAEQQQKEAQAAEQKKQADLAEKEFQEKQTQKNKDELEKIKAVQAARKNGSNVLVAPIVNDTIISKEEAEKKN
jgi:mannitol-specific phosphotransferase system IIBC component